MTIASALGLESKIIKVWNRRENRLFQEKVFSEDAMRLLYGTKTGLAFTGQVLSSAWMNRIYGLYHDSRASRKKIISFIEELNLDLGECSQPLDTFQSFNEFFARPLKEGARPIDPTPDGLVSPADGRALVFPRIDASTLSYIKWANIRLLDLFGHDESLVKRFENGACCIVRLAPADYHRYHFPLAGVAGLTRIVPGRLHSVSPYALEQGIPVFCLNKRSLCELRVSSSSSILIMEVGALLVGSMNQTYEPGRVEKGQEKGYFKFGGSTVILFFQKNSVVFDEDIIQRSSEGVETLVRMGEKIGSLKLR